MPKYVPIGLYFVLILMGACGSSSESSDTINEASTATKPEAISTVEVNTVEVNTVEADSMPIGSSDAPVADVLSVTVTGEARDYTFAVTIRSADTGCDQYADWWEVVDAQTQALLYRRILAHSHVNEQPFTRSGGPVPIQPGQSVMIRAHMGGGQRYYGGQSLKGSVETGFMPTVDPWPSLETVDPLPTGCAF